MNTVSFPGLGLEFNINPVAFNFFGGKPVYWYGIIIVAGILIACLLAVKNGKKVNITSEHISDYMLITITLSVIGARLYYVILKWENYVDDPMEIIRIWNGGLAIYGAVIMAVITMILYCRTNRIRLYDFLDIGAISLILGQSIGRWGNFMNMEAHGGETESFLRMGITEGGRYMEVHPTFLYESLWNIVGFAILLIMFYKFRKFAGQIFWSYAVWYGFGRFFIESLRTDSLMIGPVRVSQIVSAVIFIAGVAMLIKEFKKPYCPVTGELYKTEESVDSDNESTENPDEKESEEE